MPNPHLSKIHDVEACDDLVMLLWLADLGVNGLIAKEQRKTDRRDRRDQRRRAKQVPREIDGPVRRREAKDQRIENAVSETAQAEAQRILGQALERAGVKD